jgi:hypothetical protein
MSNQKLTRRFTKNSVLLFSLIFSLFLASCSHYQILMYANPYDPIYLVDKSDYIFVAYVKTKGKYVEKKAMGSFHRYEFFDARYIVNKPNLGVSSYLEILQDMKWSGGLKSTGKIVKQYSIFFGLALSNDDITPQIYIYEILDGFDSSLFLLEQKDSVKEVYMKYIDVLDQLTAS